MAQHSRVGQRLLIIDAWLSHSLDTPHTMGIFWTRDQSDAETSTWQHTTLTRDRQPCLVRDSTPKSQQASGRRPTPYFARPLGSILFLLVPVITSGFIISVCWAVTSCGIRVCRYFPPKLWKASTRLCGVTFQSSANIHRPKSPEFLCMSAVIFLFSLEGCLLWIFLDAFFSHKLFRHISYVVKPHKLHGYSMCQLQNY